MGELTKDYVEELAWAILSELHRNIPEDIRPMSWSDLSDEQAERMRRAATAAIGVILGHRCSSRVGTEIYGPDGMVQFVVYRDCRCDCVSCVTGNHADCYYNTSECYRLREVELGGEQE